MMSPVSGNTGERTDALTVYVGFIEPAPDYPPRPRRIERVFATKADADAWWLDGPAPRVNRSRRIVEPHEVAGSTDLLGRAEKAERERDEAVERAETAEKEAAMWCEQEARINRLTEDVVEAEEERNHALDSLARTQAALKTLAYELDDGLCWCPSDWFNMEDDTGYQRPDDDHSDQCVAARRAAGVYPRLTPQERGLIQVIPDPTEAELARLSADLLVVRQELTQTREVLAETREVLIDHACKLPLSKRDHGPVLFKIDAVLSAGQNTGEDTKVTHGRHCPCSACAREDWARPGVAPCGMHGRECPGVYAPLPAAVVPSAVRENEETA